VEVQPDVALTTPQVLYLLGAMLLSMALQMDRHGLWNLLGPSLFALGIMAIAWVRSHCIPFLLYHPSPCLALPSLPPRGGGHGLSWCGGRGAMATPEVLLSPCRRLAPSVAATATHPPGSAGRSTCAQVR